MTFLARLFGVEGAPETDPNYSEDIERVAQALGAMPPAQARYLAGFALLLARIANADLMITDGERLRIRQLLEKEAALSEDHADCVANLAVDRTLSNPVPE